MIAVDTSLAIPLLVRTHRAHSEVASWWARQELVLSGHALVETYSVLTRLPGDLRLSPSDAARLMSTRFNEPLVLAPTTARELPSILADLGIMGGAVYDAIVALAALDAECALATRDARAKATYDLVGVRTIVV